jgi:hypothetical protein
MNLSGNIRQRVPVLVGDNSNKGGILRIIVQIKRKPPAFPEASLHDLNIPVCYSRKRGDRRQQEISRAAGNHKLR